MTDDELIAQAANDIRQALSDGFEQALKLYNQQLLRELSRKKP